MKSNKSAKVTNINSIDDIQSLEVDKIYNFEEQSNLEYKVQEYSGYVEDKINKKAKKSSLKYLVYRKNSSEDKWMITEYQALALAFHFNYKACSTTVKHVLQHKILNNKDNQEFVYKYVAEATIREPLFLGGQEYTFTASADEDNTDKFMHSYLPEMATKRALVRTILRSMKIFGVLFDGEIFNNNDNFSNKSNVKKDKLNNKKHTSDTIKPKKHKQLSALYSMLEKPKYKKFDKLSEEELVYKFNKVKKSFQNCSVSQLEKIIYGIQQ